MVTDEQLDQLLTDLLANGWPEAIARMAVSMLDSEAVTDTFCPQCVERVKVRHPDFKNYHRTMELILNYLKGKPSEFRQVDVNITTKNIIEMNTEEREQYRQVLLQRVARPQLPSG